MTTFAEEHSSAHVGRVVMSSSLPLELNAISGYVEDPSCFKVGPLFKILEEAMREDQDNLIENVRGIYCFKVKNTKNQEGMWIINAKVGKGSVTYRGKGNVFEIVLRVPQPSQINT